MSQYVDNHSLAKDHPEYSKSIHQLKMTDAHFARILAQYEQLDKQIVRTEQGLEHLSDLDLDSLKMKRVQLKDDLVRQLRINDKKQ